MKRLLFLLVLAVMPALAQNVRYSAPFPSVSASNPPFLVANTNPKPTLAVCSSPANGTPCTNYATTYTSSGSACPNGAQDTPDPQPSACQSTGDAQGNIGFWAPPGKYDYTVCIGTTCTGPYTVTLGTTTGSSITLKTNGTPNGSQSTFNAAAGPNMTITDNGSGTVTFTSSGGGGGSPGNPTGALQGNNTGAFGGIPNTLANFSTGNLQLDSIANSRWINPSFNWSFQPGGSYTGGSPATLTFNGAAPNNVCPRGVIGADTNLYIYISNGTGTAEAVHVTGGTCTPGLASGTLTFTPANSHSGAFTVSSASTGIYEALRDATPSNINNAWVLAAPTNPPNSGYYTVYAPITLGGSVTVMGFGATMDCESGSACFNILGDGRVTGWRVSTKATFAPAAITQTACAANVSTITTSLNPPVGAKVDIQGTFNTHYLGPHVVVTSSGSSWTYTDTNCGGSGSIASETEDAGNAQQFAFAEAIGNGGSLGARVDHIQLDSPSGFNVNTFNNFIIVDNDQAFHASDIIQNSALSGCTHTYCANFLYAPGPFSPNAAVVWLTGSSISLGCAGNGVTMWSGNTLGMFNDVVQGFNEWGVSTGNARGGFGPTIISNVYEEVASCQNPLFSPTQAGTAGLILNGQNATVMGGEFPVGRTPLFAATGNQGTAYDYWEIGVDSILGSTAPMWVGSATVDSVTPSGSIPVQYVHLNFPNGGTYTLLRNSRPNNGLVNHTAPYFNGCGGGSTTACGLIASGIAQFNTQTATFNDNAATATSNSGMSAAGWSPKLQWWPATVVMSNNGGISYDTAPIGATYVGNGGISSVSCGAPYIANGILQNCLQSGTTNNGQVFGTILNDNSGSGPVADVKGRLNILQGTSLVRRHEITLVDCNTYKTLAHEIQRPSNDSCDSFIGIDTNGAANNAAGISYGASSSQSWYINNNGDGTNWKMRLNGTNLTLALPLNMNSQPIQGATTGAFSGQITSTLSTGTAPFSVASTTPVANLTASNHPIIQDCGATTACANTQKTAAIIARGSVAFPTATTVSLSSLPFTSSSTYTCVAQDVTTAAGVINATTYTSGAAVTFTETGGVNTDTMRYTCTGW